MLLGKKQKRRKTKSRRNQIILHLKLPRSCTNIEQTQTHVKVPFARLKRVSRLLGRKAATGVAQR
jgi:hypothetical protein